MKQPKAAITAIGRYLPEDKLTNQDLEKIVETNDEWIYTRTGIKERRMLKGEGLGTSYMGVRAAQEALERSGTDPKDIEVIIVATVTPDHFFPSTANLIAAELGAENAFSFDLAAACSGFIYALSTAAQFIESGRHKKVLLIGGDKMSSIIDYKDRTTCILFGDAAAAVLLEPNEEGMGLMDYHLRANANWGKDELYMKAGGSAYPATAETVAERAHYAVQKGKKVFKYAVKYMADSVVTIMERNNLKSEDVAWLVPHQANLRIIDATGERMGLAKEQVMITIEKYGNTTAATIPLCLYDYEQQLKKGDNLVLAAFGGGFTWGSVWLKWAYDTK